MRKRFKIPIIVIFILTALTALTAWWITPNQGEGGCVTSFDIVYNDVTKFNENEIRNAIKANFPNGDDWLKSSNIMEVDENGFGKIELATQFTEEGENIIKETLERIDYISKVEKSTVRCRSP